jgi:hypothetical protein
MNKVCALRTPAPERGCVSSHFPLRGVRLHSGAFFVSQGIPKEFPVKQKRFQPPDLPARLKPLKSSSILFFNRLIDSQTSDEPVDFFQLVLIGAADLCADLCAEKLHGELNPYIRIEKCIAVHIHQ